MRKIGIRNVSGVSCHLNAAIQLIFHAISSLGVTLLIQLSHELTIKEEEKKEKETCVKPILLDNHSDEVLNHAKTFVTQFGSLLDLYNRSSSNLSSESVSTHESMNPLEFYSYVSQLQLNAQEIGDAGTAMTILLDTLQKSLDTIVLYGEVNCQVLASSLHKELMHDFWRGKMIHQIRGTQYKVIDKVTVDGIMKSWIRKRIIRRPKQVRVLPCPWILPSHHHESKSFASLSTSLRCTLFEQSIRSYPWDLDKEDNSLSDHSIYITDSDNDDDDDDSYEDSSHASSCTSSSDSDSKEEEDEEEENETTTNSTSNFKTIKYSEIDPTTLPRNILFRLKRFQYKDHQVHILSDAMDIPTILDLSSFVSAPSHPNMIDTSQPLYKCVYNLQGSIVYVNNTDDNDDDEIQGENFDNRNVGHYVTYLNMSMDDENQRISSSSSSSPWILVNDEKVIPLHHDDEDRMLHLLSGRLCKMNHSKSSGPVLKAGFAIVVLYQLQQKD